MHAVIAPVSLIVSAFAPVRDARRTLTPELRLDRSPRALLLIDLAAERIAWAAAAGRRSTPRAAASRPISTPRSCCSRCSPRCAN